MSVNFADIKIYYLMEPGAEEANGPFSLVELREMWRSGVVTKTTLWAVDKMERWMPVEDIVKERTPLPDPLPSEGRGKESAPPVIPPLARAVRDIDSGGPPLLGVAGFLSLIAGGIGIIFFAVVFDVSVPGEPFERTVNLGLLSDRENGMMASAALFVTGAICLVGERLRRALADALKEKAASS